MQSEPMPNVIDNFDEFLGQLRDAAGAPLTDTITFYVTAALLTLATELAGVREQLGWFAEGAALVEFTDLDDCKDINDESVLPISTPRKV